MINLHDNGVNVTKKKCNRTSCPSSAIGVENLKLEENTTVCSEKGSKHKRFNSHQLDKDVE